MLDRPSSSFDAAPYEWMSPSLLSRQPLWAKDKPQSKADGWWTTAYAHLEQRMAALRNWRWSWWVHWSRLAEYFLPRRYLWLVTANRQWRGSPINDNIIDSSGLLAVRVCSSGMWSGFTNPSRPWINLDIALPWVELDADGKAWIEDTIERLYTVLAQSNFYTQMAQVFQDLTVFGTAPFIIYEDHEDVIRLYVPCAGEYYLASSARNTIDTFNREYTQTVAQIVEMFTIESCPPQIVKMWQTGGGDLETEFVVCHSISPNIPLARRGKAKGEVRIVPESFDFAEVYWLKGFKSEEPLCRRGFNGKPFGAMRWSLTANEPYGRSPCMDALGDNKQVQRETLRKGEFIEKGVRPPMGAHPSMKNEPASTRPGDITYTMAEGQQKGFWPLFEPNAAWMKPLVDDIAMVSARIGKCLFVDVFMAITQMQGVQPRNELELTKRDLERLQELGPVFDLVENELAIAVQRVLNIMGRRKMLKPLPQSMRGVPLKLTFVTLARLAQKSAKSVSLKDFFATGGALSSAAKAAGVPDPLRTVNLDKAYRLYGETNNVDETIFFTDEEVLEHDKARQEAMQHAQAPDQAMAAVSAAKTLSETQLGGGNALGAMMGQSPGGGVPV